MNRQVLVVSANGGVGSAVTRALLEAGDQVLATVSKPGKLAEFEQQFPRCKAAIPLDLSAADDIAARLQPFISDLDRLDAVIVCGAVARFDPAEFVPLEVFRATMEVNCVSHLAIYQAVIAALRLSKGRIIFTGSLSGRVATPLMGAYVASKFALEGLVDSMRQEAGDWGVEVVLLQPGGIDTPMPRHSSAELAVTIPNLPAKEQALYGKLYLQTQYRVNSSLDSPVMMPPARVAAAVLEALDAVIPETRYRLGDDAEQLIEASKTLPDREIDQIVLDIYRSAPV